MGLPPIHGNRAAQCAAPTVLHGYIRNTGRAGEGTRPYGESGSVSFFFVGAGHWPARRILKYDKSKEGRPDGAAPLLLVYKNNTSMERS